MTATLASSDSQKSISMTLSTSLMLDSPDIQAVVNALNAANSIIPLSTITLSGTGYTVTTVDERTYSVNIQPGNPPTFQLVSSSFWNKGEQFALMNLGAAINQLVLADGLAAMTVTYGATG